MNHKYIVGIIFLFALAVTSMVRPTRSYAQPEIEGAGENSSDSATTDELRKRIERVVEERREQIKGVVEDLLIKKGAYIGEITRISEEAITIKSNDNPNIIPLSDQLVILKGNTPASINAIEVGNWAVVMGNRSDNTIEPEYILVSATTLRPMNQLVRLGTIKSINRTELTLVPRGSQDEQVITIQKTSIFEDADGTTIKVADFDEDISVLVTAVEGKDGWMLKTMRSLAPLGDAEDAQ